MSGCRSGSVRTPWHTSESRLAVKSLISLWRIKVKPPQGHVNACSTLYCAPQTHFSGIRSGFQPYLKWIASQNAVLLKWNPCSSIGSVASQLDAPFADASSIILCSSADASSNTCAATSAMCVDLCWEILVLVRFCSASQLGEAFPSCCRMGSHNGLDREHEAVYSRAASSWGLARPSPPWRVSNARTFLIMSLMSCLPEMDGRSWLWMAASSGANSSLSMGVVLEINFHLWPSPWLYVAYAA